MRVILTFLAIAATITAATLALPSEGCAAGACYQSPCFGPGGCTGGCTCIQPGGPGSQGWCN